MQYAAVSATERRTLPPAVAVSTVAFALRSPDAQAGDAPLWLPLVRRTRAPYLGAWALPGGPTEWNETLADTALRTLQQAARSAPGYLEQLYSFGGVERSADAQRLVTIAYWALYGEHDLVRDNTGASGASAVRDQGVRAAAERDSRPRRWDDPLPSTDDSGVADPPAVQSADPNVAWFAADALPELAFDHAEIIEYALARLRAKTEYAAVAHRFLGPKFTLAQLRSVHEAVLGTSVDPANFRRQMLSQGHLVDTGERETGTRYRPARLYRFADETHGPGAG